MDTIEHFCVSFLLSSSFQVIHNIPMEAPVT